FNDTFDLLKIEWFYNYVVPVLDLEGALKIANLYKLTKGDLITIVYLEFTELVPLSEIELNSSLFDISISLLRLSKKSNIMNLNKNAPFFMKDFKQHFSYK